MRKLLRLLILPLSFVLFFSAQQCDVDTVAEQVTVHPDGGLEVFFQHTARTIDRILDSDPGPSLETGWDSVHVGVARENKEDLYYLRGWTAFNPGADLPASYASPEDPLSEWYVRFPSELFIEERGDTVFFRYTRAYPALPWNPIALLEELEEEIEAAEDALEALEESELGDFQAKWEDSGALEEAEEGGDTVTLRRYQAEFRDLMKEGSPSPLNQYQRSFVPWVRASLWDDLAFSIPVGEQLCGEFTAESMRLAGETVDSLLEGYTLSEEYIFAALLDEAGIEPDSTVFPELVPTEFDLWDEAWIEDLESRAREAVRNALRRECQLSGPDLIEFDRRLGWLNDRYRIANLEIRNQIHGFSLALPGELIETNADTVVDGTAEWGFSVRDLFEREVTITATSRLIRN